MRKDVAELVRRAVTQGWRSELRKSGSILLFSPDGRTIVTMHSTPSDVNWQRAAIRQLRRGGFDPDDD
jgi:hypothetical protein